jgi:hypothetical protein
MTNDNPAKAFFANLALEVLSRNIFPDKSALRQRLLTGATTATTTPDAAEPTCNHPSTAKLATAEIPHRGITSGAWVTIDGAMRSVSTTEVIA